LNQARKRLADSGFKGIIVIRVEGDG